MEDGASIILESSWALNIPEERSIKTQLSGTKAGADNFDGLAINGEKEGRLFKEQLETSSSNDESPGDIEMRLWIKSIRENTEPPVKAEEALVVSQILEAIYHSAKTGEAYKF